MPLSANDLEWFAARLSIAVYDTNREHRARLSINDIKSALSHVPGIDTLTMQYGAGDTQIFALGDGRTVTLPRNWSVDDLDAALIAPAATPLPPLPYPTVPDQNMSLTGFRPGAIRAAIDAAKQKSQDDLDAAMAKLAAAQDKAASVPAAIAQVAASMAREADDALQELATFTNGGPSL